MVLGQHASSKLQNLLPQHKRIRMPSKSTVRVGKIVHSPACNPKHASQSLRANHVIIVNLTYVGMVLGKIASKQLQHLLLQHKRIRMPSKSTVRVGKIMHGDACNPKRASQSLRANHVIIIILTYVRMVLGQHASSKLQNLLQKYKSIRMPSKSTVRNSKTVHSAACNPKRASHRTHANHVIINSLT
jgi:hypothetical protein